MIHCDLSFIVNCFSLRRSYWLTFCWAQLFVFSLPSAIKISVKLSAWLIKPPKELVQKMTLFSPVEILLEQLLLSALSFQIPTVTNGLLFRAKLWFCWMFLPVKGKLFLSIVATWILNIFLESDCASLTFCNLTFLNPSHRGPLMDDLSDLTTGAQQVFWRKPRSVPGWRVLVQFSILTLNVLSKPH